MKTETFMSQEKFAEHFNSMEKGKDAGISSVVEIPIQDSLTDYGQIVRERLSRTPFVSLVNAVRNGTRQDQLSCMLQVERLLLQYRQVALCCRYTRRQFLEEMQSLLRLFGLEACSGLLREYQRSIPRKAMLRDFES